VELVQITSEITALVTPMPVPGVGFLPVNAFVITTGSSPILVDTCVSQPPGEFVAALGKVIDPEDLNVIWLTHADRDHTGAIQEVLKTAPNARVFTNFTTVGHLTCGTEPLPMDRVLCLNPGTRIDVDGHTLVALRPPLFDNPGTVGFFDEANGILVSSDCFGGPMATFEEVLVPDVSAIDEEQVMAGQLLWGSADSPWVHSVDQSKFAASLNVIRALDPRLVLSTHLPAIHGDLERHLGRLAMLPDSTPFVTPDQAALEAMLAQMEPVQG
jgi:hypothetical protein